MTDILKLEAQEKIGAGSGVARQLRREDRLPAMIYGDNEKNLMISLPLNKFNNEYKKGGMKTKLIEIVLNGKSITTLPKEIQLHPVTDMPEHIDLLRIGKDSVVEVAVAVRILNAEKSTGVKKGGVVNTVHREILVQCHPTSIPHYIDIDIADLDIGQNIHMSQIALPKGVSAVDKSDFTVVSLANRVEESEVSAAPGSEIEAVVVDAKGGDKSASAEASSSGSKKK